MRTPDPRPRSRLRKEREARLWTREDLAERSDVTIGTIYLIESGQVVPRFSTMQQILEAFELPDSDASRLFRSDRRAS